MAASARAAPDVATRQTPAKTGFDPFRCVAIFPCFAKREAYFLASGWERLPTVGAGRHWRRILHLLQLRLFICRASVVLIFLGLDVVLSTALQTG
jgi:hypothetical protein